MRIGSPKEIKVHEYRVGLVPASVADLVGAGHEVLMETGAGAGIGVGDEDYERAGAAIAADAGRSRNRSPKKSPCCVTAKPCLPICISRPIRIRRAG
jgi:NAD/NADP transhydrogenase alpha subunit